MKAHAARNANILIVDDVPENLTILANILTECGYTVRPAINGTIALKAANHVPPDLILLDIMMPGLDGYEVCRRLKDNARTRDIPVIFISALDETLNKLKAFEEGGVDYVTKPFEAAEVVARVNTHLDLQRMQQQLRAQNEQLQGEIRRRQQMEEALLRYNRELSLMNAMSSGLQSCANADQMVPILARTCEQLFPGDSGYLALMNDDNTVLEQCCAWGGYAADGRSFAVRDYPALFSEHQPAQEERLALDLGRQFEAGTDHAAQSMALLISANARLLGVFILIRHASAEDDDDGYSAAMRWTVANNVVEHYSLALANITLREALRLEAIRDPLTGLYNRRYMEEALNREARRATRKQSEIGIIMLDIDHFKPFNDTHGHDAGDVILQQLGTLLDSIVRGGDIACRYGGEEFLLILPEITPDAIQQRSLTVLDRIRALRIAYGNQEFRITVSMGMAMFPRHAPDVQTVVSLADDALYQAKRQGRNQAVLAAFPTTERV